MLIKYFTWLLNAISAYRSRGDWMHGILCFISLPIG